MLRISLVESALEDIGWGTYHTKLFFNCSFGWGVAYMWVQAISLIYKEFEKIFIDVPKTMLSGITASFNLGCAIGCYCFAMMTDKYGRSFVFKKTIYVTCISSVLLIFSSSFWTITGSCFFLGIGVGGDIAVPPAVFIESVPPSLRKRAALMNLGYCVGPLISTLSMQLTDLWWFGPLPNWKFFVCIIAALTIIVAVVRNDVLESPVFLYRSRDDDFHLVIKEIAQSNNRSSYDDVRVPFLVKEGTDFETQQTYGLKDIFKGELLKKTIFLGASVSVFTFSFYGVLFFEPTLLMDLIPNEQYYVQLTDQIFGVLALFFSVYSVESCFGRRFTFVMGSVGSGILCLVIIMSDWPLLVIGCVSGVLRFFILLGIAGKNLLTSESFPAHVRGVGVGFIFTLSRFVSILSTLCIGVIKHHSGDEYVLVMLFCSFLLSGFIAVFVSETKISR